MPETTSQTTSPAPDRVRLGKWMVLSRRPRPAGRKTDVWEVWNTSGVFLGLIAWRGTWRQFVFQPEPRTDYAASCLSDLAGFVGRLNAEHKRREGL